MVCCFHFQLLLATFPAAEFAAKMKNVWSQPIIFLIVLIVVSRWHFRHRRLWSLKEGILHVFVIYPSGADSQVHAPDLCLPAQTPHAPGCLFEAGGTSSTGVRTRCEAKGQAMRSLSSHCVGQFKLIAKTKLTKMRSSGKRRVLILNVDLTLSGRSSKVSSKVGNQMSRRSEKGSSTIGFGTFLNQTLKNGIALTLSCRQLLRLPTAKFSGLRWTVDYKHVCAVANV